jgi:tricorn protease
VNGKAVDPALDPRAAFVGLRDKDVQVTVGPRPVLDASARTIVVRPVGSETDLRRRDWVERNRRHVLERSGGRIGYVHVPNFTTGGFDELARQFYGQIDTEALIADTRWSTGGWTGAVVAELLDRRPLNAAASRESKEAWPVPRWGAHVGPKAVLLNHITVSAGENFAYYVRKLGVGPLIGSRTWGGLTGLNPVPSLIDGGYVNVPNAPFFDETGWVIEGHGVDPDIVVDPDPARWYATGEDAQLEAAVKALLDATAGIVDSPKQNRRKP